jgi:hypothetical protein
VVSGQKRPAIPGGVLADAGLLMKSGDGWVARLRLVPKKA